MEKVILQAPDVVEKKDDIIDFTKQQNIRDLICISKVSRAMQIVKKYIKQIPYKFIKRFIDICVGMIGTIMLLPIMLIVKLVNIKNKDYAPILFKQKRIGKNGKLIYIYKIRSMVPNAQEVLQEMLKEKRYEEEWKKHQKFEDDPRITKIGRFLRKTSLDEFPQFYNVLKGNLSLIGPRPLIEGELDEHNGNHGIYESVKPGITGWWGCNGRSATTYEKRLELEYYYVKHCNIILDIKCVVKTLVAVLTKEGAK